MLSSGWFTWLFQPSVLMLSLAAVLFVYIVSIRYRSHLRTLPGPFLASISNVPRLLSVRRSDMHKWQVALHRRYGKVVRVGPNHVSIADPEALHVIYSTGSGFLKSDLYNMFDAKYGPHQFVPTNFSCRDDTVHKAMVKPTLSAFNQVSILRQESLLDECITTFHEKVEERITREPTDSTVMNFSKWLHYFAFDVITSITFSNRFDFVKSETDVHGIIEAMEGRLKYNCFIGQIPWLHSYLLRSEWGSWFANWIPAFAKMNTSAKIVELTRSEVKRQEQEKTEGYVDMLNIWRTKNTSGGLPMSDAELVGAAVANVLAGSHSTAGVIRDLMYYLLKHPEYEARLRQEVDEAENARGFGEIVTYHQAKEMSYFQACLKESMRVHPGFGMNLERVVPHGGVKIAGYFLPAGTIVGANPWVFGRDLEVYGEDADCFKPERWLNAWMEAAADDQAAKTKLHRMEANFFNFGMGNRGCMGRNLALTVVNKFVPQLMRHFDVELADSDRELKAQNLFFLNELGMECRLRKRTLGGEE